MTAVALQAPAVGSHPQRAIEPWTGKEPGIYFGLPEDDYHKDPALSSSGIRKLLTSPLDFWVNSPLNPAFVDEKTEAMIVGTAFHRRLLEPERFAQLYAVAPAREDYPDAVDGAEDLRKLCADLGVKKSGTIADMCERILEANPGAELWPVIKAGLLKQTAGKIVLRPSVQSDIERAARIVLMHQAAVRAMSGGYAEVSIFWIDPESGVRLKARLDYLKVKAIVDLKTFSNPLGKPIGSAVASAVANGGYHVQAVMYDQAVKAAKYLLRTQKSAAVHFVGHDVPNDWLTSFAACETHAFVFVFIEQGPVTNVVVREFRRVDGNGGTENIAWSAGRNGIREAIRTYETCMATHGPDKPWIVDYPMAPFSDVEFPIWMMN